MAVPAGYYMSFGFWYKTDGSGPYVFDGAAMALMGTGSGGGGGGGWTPDPASRFAPTTVNSSATAGQLMAANANRRGHPIIYNSDENELYILLDGALGGSPDEVTVTRWNYRIPSGATWECPPTEGGKCYKGAIRGIWAADGTGAAFLSEPIL